MGSQHERIPADRQWQKFTSIMRAHENDQLLIRIEGERVSDRLRRFAGILVFAFVRYMM